MEEKKSVPAPEIEPSASAATPAGERAAAPAVRRSAFPDLLDFLVIVGIYFVAQGIGALVAWSVAGWPDMGLLLRASESMREPAAVAADTLMAADSVGGVTFVETAAAAIDPAAVEAQQTVMAHFNALSFFVSMALTLGGVLLYRKRRGGTRTIAHLSKRGFNPLLLLWGLALMVSATIVTEPVLDLLPAVPNVYGRGVWALVTLVVMAPLFEETLFRGVILESARARYGTLAAWAISSLVFGLAHLHPALVVNAFVLGLVLGYIYIRTDSLWSTVILHAVNNALAYLMLVAGWQDVMLIRLIGNRSLYIAVYCVALAAFAASGYMVYRTLRRMEAEEKSAGAA